MLRKARIILSVVIFGLITFYFLDFAEILPNSFHRLAHIQFVPALMSLSFIILAVLILITLLLGRIYCSTICPMGIFQDIVTWISKKTAKKKKRFRGMLGHWFGLFLVIIISIVIFYCLSNMVHILKAVRTLVKLLMPVIYGLVIAYLLNPLMVFYGNVFYRLFGRKIPEDEERHVERYQKFSKVISLILAMIRSADHYRAALDADPAGV